jgi:hypothetical protein
MVLTDTQLTLLSGASQREDHLVVIPETPRGGAKGGISKLLRSGLIEEILIGPGSPRWREDDEGQPIGLRITSVGLAAIGVDLEETGVEIGSVLPIASEATPDETAQAGRRLPSPPPRAGTKRAQLIALLQREGGATLPELIQATGWLPHTTRAALTGLRKKGYALVRSQNERGESAYRILLQGA